MASIGLPTEGILSAGASVESVEAEVPGNIEAGKPKQALIIRDSQVRGRDVVVSVSSQYGPQIGLTTPVSGNIGGLTPTVTGDPDDKTEPVLSIQLVSGGGIGSAEWVWGSDDDSVGWLGAHGDIYPWGHHAPYTSNFQGAVVVYSSVFRRVIVIAHDTTEDEINVRWVGVNERPVEAQDWNDHDNEVTFTPENGIHQDGHALAACELRDGTLLLAVRQEATGTSGTSMELGDIDIYKSVDGGETWDLCVEEILLRFGNQTALDERGCIRMAASGDWVRICYVASDGSIETMVSADAGSTWKVVDFLEDGTDIENALGPTEQTNDIQPYDLLAVDDSTGAFILVANPAATGTSNRLGIWYATRDEAWSRETGLFADGAPTLPATPRSFVLYRDPYWVWLWVYTADPGLGDGSDLWSVFRVERDRVITQSAWTAYLQPLRLKGVSRLCPIQARAVWCDDRAAFIGYLQDIETSTPYSRKAARPWLHWVGGWSRRPANVNPYYTDGIVEKVHWAWTMGEPKGGATSSTQSSWGHSVAGGGTHSWNARGWVDMSTDAVTDLAKFSLDLFSGTDPLPKWDPESDELEAYRRQRLFALEWVMNVGQTASATLNRTGVRIKQPSLGGGGYGWTLSVVVGTDRVAVYDEIGGSFLATMASLALNTYETTRFHRFRFCVSPATSPSNPTAVLQYRREDGDDWRETSFTLPAPSASAGHTMQTIEFGHLFHGLGGGLTQISAWRELHGWGEWFRTDYTNFSAPADLPGAVCAIRPRGMSAGFAAGSVGVSSDPGRLRVSWGGIGGQQGDQWESRLTYDYPVEAITMDSPQLLWMSTAGATAGARIVYDACRGAASDDGRRFVHRRAAIFGLTGRRAQIIYSDDASGLVGATTINIDTDQYSGLRVSSVSGRVVSVATTNAYAFREGELAGRYLRMTAGTSCQGHIHKIESHQFDGSNHLLVLATGGQFAFDQLTAGASASVFSDRAWVEFEETQIKRYMTLVFGQSGDNNWDGRWACSAFVPGVGFTFNPPLNWSHTDEETPNVTIHRARNGQSWAYEEGPPTRTWVGRQVGDVEGARAALRDLLRTLAKYAEEPIAFLLNDESTEDQERGLWLTRWVRGSHLDQAAYARRSVEGNIRGIGDQQIELEELV